MVRPADSREPLAPTIAANVDQLHQLLQYVPAAAYLCDEAGLITYFNAHAVEFWGRAPKLRDPVDRFCGSFRLYSADGTPIRHEDCWMALALRLRQSFIGEEIVVERPDGQRVIALAHANPLFDATGALIGAVNILIDITERRAAEQSARFLASIVESSNDAIVSKDLEGRVRTWNAGAERIFGYSAAEAVGQPITMIIPPELHDEERSILQRLRQGEQIEHFETIRVDSRGNRKPISLSISPIRDERGRIIGAAKVARDISAQKAAEAELVALQEELTAQVRDLQQLQQMSLILSTTRELQPILKESLRTASAISGADRSLLSLYDAQRNLLTVGASMGFEDQTARSIAPDHPGIAACIRDRRRVIVEDAAADPENAGRRDALLAAGIRAVHSTPLVTRAGEIIGVLSLEFCAPHRPSPREIGLLDVCARQAVDFIENARLYEQLRAADRRKDEFLAVLAHELRNPLAPLTNSLHIMRLAQDLSPDIESLRGIMETQLQHLVRLVDDLLEVSRITCGKIELRRQEVELASIISTAVETSRPHIEAAAHQLAIQVAPEAVYLDADAMRLAQVVSNLLNNAAKYTPRGGQIWLTAGVEQEQAVIGVRDNGIGISADMLPHIFEMFSQVEQARRQAQGGLGLGLAVARGLVEMHGGTIDARSAGPQRGSQFVIRLPIVRVARPTPVAAAAGEQQRQPLPSRRILIVDDTRVAAHTLGKLLEALGQQVRIAANAGQALAMLATDRPDLVISDIAMPGMDGYELAQRIRRDPDCDEVVLVALTGYGQEEDRRRALAAGFRHHLVKPVGLQSLEQLLMDVPVTGGEPEPEWNRPTEHAVAQTGE